MKDNSAKAKLLLESAHEVHRPIEPDRPGRRLPAASTGPALLKDETLNQLADVANVAQFISFTPGDSLAQRFSRLCGYPANQRFASAEEAVDALLSASNAGSVNVRSFQAVGSKGSPFTYGLRDRDSVLAVVRRHAQAGLYTIVNETLDVRDGGVSGVALGGVVEFAPEDTSRAVEKAGTVALEHGIGTELLETVYGFAPELDYAPNVRVEFSIHPLAAGVRHTHTIVWQMEEVAAVDLSGSLVWPNRFSQFIGDKVFGLLVAHALGLPVPATTVVSRNVAPFRFGRPTGSAETWIRTCPKKPVPGKFTTQRGWRDPFTLLAEEDPDGGALASVLAQEGVPAKWSGAAVPSDNGRLVVEGVSGFGDEFMLGRRAPQTPPAGVVTDVTAAVTSAAAKLGPVRIEWAHDGDRAWVLQLHLTTKVAHGGVIYPGEPSRWRSFDPTEGLDSLSVLIAEASSADEGILVTGDIGITSHVGDLLREAAVPARIARPVRSQTDHP
jgi:hypothetical protein